MKTSDTINELATALCKAQGEMENVTKDSDNPFFKSKYADLAACIIAARSPLSVNGLSVIQVPELTEHGVKMVTRILHCSGQWVEGELECQPKDFGPQAIGSVITYLRRYMLTAMIGLAAEDDDGEAGQGRKPTAEQEGIKPPKRGSFSGKSKPPEAPKAVDTPWGEVPPPQDSPQAAAEAPRDAMSAYSKASSYVLAAQTKADVMKASKRIAVSQDQYTSDQFASLEKIISERLKALEPEPVAA